MACVSQERGHVQDLNQGHEDMQLNHRNDVTISIKVVTREVMCEIESKKPKRRATHAVAVLSFERTKSFTFIGV